MKTLLVALILFFLFADSAQANAGVPVVMLTFPVFIILLIPIILLETKILANIFGKVFKDLLWPVAKANLFSTLLGVPVAWLNLLVLQLITQWADAAWIVPYFGRDSSSVLPTATLCNLLVCFIVSIYFEKKVLKRFFMNIDEKFFHAGIVKANLCSYVVLISFYIVLFIVFHYMGAYR